MIESKRVKIYPANKEQMENQIVAEKDPELKKTYKEMLQGCIDHPDLWDWYAMWISEEGPRYILYREIECGLMFIMAVKKQSISN